MLLKKDKETKLRHIKHVQWSLSSDIFFLPYSVMLYYCVIELLVYILTERALWRLFQKRVVRIKFDIYAFINKSNETEYCKTNVICV